MLVHTAEPGLSVGELDNMVYQKNVPLPIYSFRLYDVHGVMTLYELSYIVLY